MLDILLTVPSISYSQSQKACERAEADLKNVQNILNSIGISEIETFDATDNILEKVQNNINTLHRKSEELMSRNLSLKVEIDKLKNNSSASDVSTIYIIFIDIYFKVKLTSDSNMFSV